MSAPVFLALTEGHATHMKTTSILAFARMDLRGLIANMVSRIFPVLPSIYCVSIASNMILFTEH